MRKVETEKEFWWVLPVQKDKDSPKRPLGNHATILIADKLHFHLFLFDCFNPNIQYIVEGGKEQKEIAAYTTDDGREVLIKQTMRYENKTQINRIEWHYFINGKFNSIQNLDMRMFFPQELDSYLEWNGFHINHKYGGFEEEAFDDNSAKQIFICQCDLVYWDFINK